MNQATSQVFSLLIEAEHKLESVLTFAEQLEPLMINESLSQYLLNFAELVRQREEEVQHLLEVHMKNLPDSSLLNSSASEIHSTLTDLLHALNTEEIPRIKTLYSTLERVGITNTMKQEIAQITERVRDYKSTIHDLIHQFFQGKYELSGW